MKILVTGATGFIGRHIIASLLGRRDCELYIIARDEKKAGEIFNGNVTIYKGDITLPKSLCDVFKDKDIIIHSAALMSNYEYEGKDRYYEVNVKGLSNILACCEPHRLKRFLHISSAGVYGRTEPIPVREDSFYGSGLSVYEWSKKEAESVLLEYCRKYSVPFTILRLSQMYGPGMHYGWPDTIRAIAKGKMLIPGKGNARIHLLHIRDCINAVNLALNNDIAINKIYNIAGPEILKLNEVFKIISCILGVDPPRSIPYFIPYSASLILSLLPNFMKTGNIRLLTPHRVSFFRSDHIYDISSVKRDLGYEPCVKVKEGFSEMISWCRKEGLV